MLLPEQSSEIPGWLGNPMRTRKLNPEEERALFETVRRGKSAAVRLSELPAERVLDAAELATLNFEVTAGEKARNKLLEHTSWVVRSSIKRITAVVRVVSFSDLFGVGLRALNQAIDKFDPDRDATLATYAWESIQHSLRAEIRELRPGPRLSDHAERILRKLKKARQRLLQELGCEPSIAEIAQAAGCSREKAEDVWMTTQVVSLTDPSGERISEDADVRSGGSVFKNRVERALDHKKFLVRLASFLAVQVVSAPVLTQEEKHTAQVLAKRLHGQLKEEGEASRPRSALEWRVLIRALAANHGMPLSATFPEELLPVYADLPEALLLRKRRLELVSKVPCYASNPTRRPELLEMREDL